MDNLIASRLVIFVAVVLIGVGIQAGADDNVGWSDAQPASGRFVRTNRGFMVPYTMQIPGTDDEFSMEPIPGGTFWLGSPESEAGRDSSEGPRIQVTLSPFWLGRHEVSWAQYKEFMSLYAVFKEFESHGLRTVTNDNAVDAITAPTELYDPSFTFEFGEDPQQPAVTMTQYAAKQYTKWLSGVTGHSYRLPSEAEWEYACRAGTSTPYSFGEDAGLLDEYAWHAGNSDGQSRLVGEKKPNPWGLYDMHGNVWEWVLDAYSRQGYELLAGKNVKGLESVAWPSVLFPRTVRGGSWDDPGEACRSASKMPSHDIEWKSEDPNLPLSPWWFTSDPARAVGFRVLRPAKPVSKEAMAKFWDADVEDIRFSVRTRLQEGRGVLGLVDKELPSAIEQLKELK